jgi:hypothetical protein
MAMARMRYPPSCLKEAFSEGKHPAYVSTSRLSVRQLTDRGCYVISATRGTRACSLPFASTITSASLLSRASSNAYQSLRSTE